MFAIYVHDCTQGNQFHQGRQQGYLRPDGTLSPDRGFDIIMVPSIEVGEAEIARRGLINQAGVAYKQRTAYVCYAG